MVGIRVEAMWLVGRAQQCPCKAHLTSLLAESEMC